jgi:uncharacterized protein
MAISPNLHCCVKIDVILLFTERTVSSTLDRLRRLHSLRPQQKVEPDLPEPSVQAAISANHRLETLVPGEEVENEAGSCYVTTARYTLETVRGRRALTELLGRTPVGLARLYPTSSLDGPFDFGRVAFLDTETTGLGGGAGVYAFMVGVGTFEGAPEGTPREFVVRQFFMRHPGEELALLTALAQLLDGCTGLVSFNGRTFDAPLLRTRYRLNRHYLKVDPPLSLDKEEAPHLDLLHPARRLWKGRLESCSLSFLERAILSHQRSEEDVPGSLIPLLYQQYLQQGDAQSMRRVFYHNLEDIVSMVFLSERICRHFADPLYACDEELHGHDLLALGQIHEQLDQVECAERALRHAADLLEPSPALAEVYATLGRLLKRQERWSEAAVLWQQWITTIPGPDPRPYEELAKYCEWQTGDLAGAEMWTAWALHNQRTASSWQRSRQSIDELSHRLERIRNKRQRQPDHTSET